MQKIVPAILTDSAVDLAKKLKILAGNTQWVQIDIQDGLFVPNSSVELSQLERVSESFDYEIHLMVQNPAQYFDACQSVGAKRVIFHIEAALTPERMLQEMARYSFEWGLALNPETPLEGAKRWKQQIDSFLLLSVYPGKQGNEFLPAVLEKMKALKMFSPERLLGMDGGINAHNMRQAFEAGADYVVVGSSIWKSKDPIAALRKLEAMVQ